MSTLGGKIYKLCFEIPGVNGMGKISNALSSNFRSELCQTKITWFWNQPALSKILELLRLWWIKVFGLKLCN